MKGALITVSAQLGNLGYGIGGIPQQHPRPVDAQGIDLLAEIDIELLGENVA